MTNKKVWIVVLIVGLLYCFINYGLAEEKGLVAYLNFDEREGKTVKDFSGNGNDGAIHGEPQWVEGIRGYALKFDGVNDYVDCGNNPSLDFTDKDFTVEAWFKKSAFGTGIIVSRSTGASERGWWLNIYSNDSFQFATFPGYVHDYTAPGVLMLGLDTWYHFAATRTGANVKLYINGVEPPTSHSKGDHSTLNGASAPIRIGIHGDGKSYGFNGTIDEVRIYNRVLTTEEIKEHYEMGLQSNK